MRSETVQLTRQAVSEGRRAYVLVNNRAEGQCALDGAGPRRDATRLGQLFDRAMCTACSQNEAEWQA